MKKSRKIRDKTVYFILLLSIVLPWLRIAFPVPCNIRITNCQAQCIEGGSSNSKSQRHKQWDELKYQFNK